MQKYAIDYRFQYARVSTVFENVDKERGSRRISRPNVSIDSVGYSPSFRKTVKHSSKKLSYPGASFQSSIRGMKLPRIVLSFKPELALAKKKKERKRKERKKREKKTRASLSLLLLAAL